MSFPAYPEYKESGVSWLGEVPGHWKLCRIGSRFTERREKVSDTDFPPLSVTKHGIVPQLETAAKTDDNDNRKGVRAGDFVINSRSDRKGSSGLSSLDGSVSLINTVIRPDDTMHGAFVHHLLRSVAFQEEYYRYGKGIVADLWSTNYGEMKAITLAVPPIGEQEAIAAFLDRETAKIDTLVAEQERLIALLKEKRQAVISHAVTKGLNPHAPMKDSGIEWFGEIPAHWEVGKLFYGARLQSGYAFSSGDFGSEGVPVVRMNNLNRGKLDLSEAVRISDAVCNPAVALCPGDLVWGMSGSIGDTGSLGNFAVVVEHDIPCQLNQRVGRFLINKNRMAPEFLQIWIQSQPFYLQIMLAVTGTAQFNVSAEQVQSTMAAFPPLDEQQLINEYITGECLRFASIIDEAQAAITLLQERRAALISAAVTGKIDVRGLVDASAAAELETV